MDGKNHEMSGEGEEKVCTAWQEGLIRDEGP